MAKSIPNVGIDPDDITDTIAAFTKKTPLPNQNNVSPIGKFSPDRQSTLTRAGIETGQLPVSKLLVPQNEPSALKQVVDVAGNVAGTGANLAIGVAGAGEMLIAPAALGVTKLTGYIGKKTGAKVIENAGNNANAKIKKFTSKTFAEVMPEKGIIASGVQKLSNAAGFVVGKVGGVFSKKSSVNTVANEIKDLPKIIGKSNVLSGAMNTAFIAGSALSIFGVTKGFVENLASLKAMHKDITGKDASTVGVLFGKVSAPVAEARSQLLKSFTVSGATDVASLGLVVASALRGNVSIAKFLAPQAVSMAAGAFIGDSFLPHYKGFKEMHASGQPIPKEAYAAFLGAASPELRARGGENSVYTQKLAEKYAAQKKSPQEVMQEISKDGLKKEIRIMIGEVEATKKAATAATATVGAANAASEQPTHSHVAALQGQRTGQPTQAVMGKHTEQLVTNAAKANQALAPQQPVFGGA